MQSLLLMSLLCSSPSVAVDSATLDIRTISPQERIYTRYLSLWPLPEDQQPAMDATLRFWVASISPRRQMPEMVWLKDAGLWRLNIADCGWDAADWEALVKLDPYFNPLWIDPLAEKALRFATHSQCGVMRADYFLARTSLEVGGKGFKEGVYSLFLDLPDKEKQLLEQFGAKEQLGKNYLARGGAVLSSTVALHNRELQLFPSLIGADDAFLWRSLDTDSDVAKDSVIENFLGTIAADGKEFIGSNLNGTHWYYLSNGAGDQASEVPTNIAQDRDTVPQHDVTVMTPWKCVACHGQTGINHFDDVVKRIALSREAGLAVIDKQKPNKAVQEKLEDYYLSDLGRTIKRQQESYTATIKAINGLTPIENRDQYVAAVQQHLYGRIDLKAAAVEIGCKPESAGAILRASGHAQAIAVAVGESISREAWESAYPDVMQAQEYPWESNDVEREHDAELEELKRAVLPRGVRVLPAHADDQPGDLRYQGSDGRVHLLRAGGVHLVWDADRRRWVSGGGRQDGQ